MHCRRRLLGFGSTIALVGALLVAGCGGGGSAALAGKNCAAKPGARSTGRAGSPVPHFDHVILVVFENEECVDIMGSSDAPTFRRLARTYAVFTSYYGVTHPSLPNYLALVSGSTHGITRDCDDCLVGGRNLADTLAAKAVSWKTYAEGLPAAGSTVDDEGRYVKRHDPLLYFHDVLSNGRRLARIVPYTQFRHDLRTDHLPGFALVVPNLCHDMHDCGADDGDQWLKSFLRPVLRSSELNHGVVFIVFDEGDKGDTVGGGGHTVALAVGPTVRPRSRVGLRLNHYNLLRTIEDGLGLPRLGNSRSARPITGIWRG
jgi:acid phosphatase